MSLSFGLLAQMSDSGSHNLLVVFPGTCSFSGCTENQSKPVTTSQPQNDSVSASHTTASYVVPCTGSAAATISWHHFVRPESPTSSWATEPREI